MKLVNNVLFLELFTSFYLLSENSQIYSLVLSLTGQRFRLILNKLFERWDIMSASRLRGLKKWFCHKLWRFNHNLIFILEVTHIIPAVHLQNMCWFDWTLVFLSTSLSLMIITSKYSTVTCWWPCLSQLS